MERSKKDQSVKSGYGRGRKSSEKVAMGCPNKGNPAQET